MAIASIAVAVHASPPTQDLHQLHHTSWSIEEGAPPDIWAIAQARDGFLMLGTGAGLYRFDGIRFEEVRPIGDMPSRNVTALMAMPNGDLWIGYYTGQISLLRGGRLKTFSSHGVGGSVHQFASASDGSIWAARSATRYGLARFAAGRWTIVGPAQGLPRGAVASLVATADGAVWVVSGNRLYRAPRGERFIPFATADKNSRLVTRAGEQPIALDNGGTTSATTARTIRLKTYDMVEAPADADVKRAIVDRDGVIWRTGRTSGLTRIVPGSGQPHGAGRVEHWFARDGLTANAAVPIFEDREGAIWVGTNLGLDRFRAANIVRAVPTPDPSHGSMLARTEGSDDVYVLAHDRVLLRSTADRTLDTIATLPRTPALMTSDGRDLLIEQDRRMVRLHGHELAALPYPALPGLIQSWSRDRAGTPWITIGERGAFTLREGAWHHVRLSPDPVMDGAMQSAPLSPGGEWFYAGDTLLRRTAAGVEHLSRFHPGLGQINTLTAHRRGILVGADFGIAVIDVKGSGTIASSRAPALAGITGIVVTPDEQIWANGVRGVVHTSVPAIVESAHSGRPLRYRLFGVADGLPGVALQGSNGATALLDGVGRIWFVANNGVAWINPSHLYVNPYPPQLAIRGVIAGDRTYPAEPVVILPGGTRRLQIDYTALSLADPDRIRFRYRLEGVDTGWIPGGGRRQAVYTNLGPGRWTFRLVAANGDGIWNARGQTLEIDIPPTFVESTLFRLLCIALAICSATLLARWRLRRVAEYARARVEAQLGERERIARELHDTLLQGMQGVILRFQTVSNLLLPGSRAQELMDDALQRSDDVFLEGRERLMDLREEGESDLVDRLRGLVDTHAANPASVSIVTSGQRRPVRSPALHELVAAAGEALANALRHAEARTIVVTATFSSRDLRVAVTDDGRGFCKDAAIAGHKPGHYGLQGMRERLHGLRGSFNVVSSPRGTTVSLCLPASVAYPPPDSGRRSWIRKLLSLAFGSVKKYGRV